MRYLFILLLFITAPATAQYRWDKLYNFSTDTIISGGSFTCYTDTGRFMISGNVFDSYTNDIKNFLAAFDNNGDQLWKRYFYITNYTTCIINYGGTQITSYAPGRYVLTSMYMDAGINTQVAVFQPFLYFFNSQGDSIRYVPLIDTVKKRYFKSIIADTTHHLVAAGLISSRELHPVFTGVDYDSNSVWLVKFDTTGQVVWQKQFFSESYTITGGGYAQPLSITLSADKKHYVIFAGVFNLSRNGDDMTMIKTDLDGNVVWTKWLPKKYTMSQQGQLTALRNGGYAFSTSETISKGGAMDTIMMYYGKVNESGDTVWTGKIRHYFPGQTDGLCVTEKEDGKIVFMGTSYYGIGYPFMLQTDSNGHVEWQKAYKRIPTMYIDQSAFTLNLVPGNRLLMTGIVTGGAIPGVYDTSGSIVRMIMVDSLGCQVENCHTAVDDISGDGRSGWQLIPNPNNGTFHITGMSAGEQTLLEVTNAIGQLVYRQQIPKGATRSSCQIVLPGIVPGIYLLKATTTSGSRFIKFIVN